MLAASERWHVLDYLRLAANTDGDRGGHPGTEQGGGPAAADATVPVETLAEHLADVDERSADSVERHLTELHHRHLPVLAEHTAVSYDWAAGLVEYSSDPTAETVMDAFPSAGVTEG